MFLNPNIFICLWRSEIFLYFFFGNVERSVQLNGKICRIDSNTIIHTLQDQKVFFWSSLECSHLIAVMLKTYGHKFILFFKKNLLENF